jgi:DNA-binding transcriptional LysR family regulator
MFPSELPRAATDCNVTQPALTKGIKALEGGLGASRFHREGRRILLSEFGRSMLPHLQHIADEADVAIRLPSTPSFAPPAVLPGQGSLVRRHRVMVSATRARPADTPLGMLSSRPADWPISSLPSAPVIKPSIDRDHDSTERHSNEDPAVRVEIWDEPKDGGLRLGRDALRYLYARRAQRRHSGRATTLHGAAVGEHLARGRRLGCECRLLEREPLAPLPRGLEVGPHARLAVNHFFVGAIEIAMVVAGVDEDAECSLHFVGCALSGARDFQLIAAFALRPRALDIVENGANIRIAQQVCEAGHVALVPATDDCGGAFLDDPEQDLVGMVPCVAALVVRRCGQSTRGKPLAPVGLALQICAVAGGALICIDLASLRDDVRRRYGGGCGTGITPACKGREDHTSDDKANPDSISESFSQDVYPQSLQNFIRVLLRAPCASGEAPATMDILVSNAEN